MKESTKQSEDKEKIKSLISNAQANAKDGLATLNRIMDANYVVGLAYVAGCLTDTLRAVGRLRKTFEKMNQEE